MCVDIEEEVDEVELDWARCCLGMLVVLGKQGHWLMMEGLGGLTLHDE